MSTSGVGGNYRGLIALIVLHIQDEVVISVIIDNDATSAVLFQKDCVLFYKRQSIPLFIVCDVTSAVSRCSLQKGCTNPRSCVLDDNEYEQQEVFCLVYLEQRNQYGEVHNAGIPHISSN